VSALVRGLAVPLAAGAACVLGFAPFYAWPVPIAMVAILFHVFDRSGSARQAAISGFAFGLGYFVFGVSWMYVSLHDFGAMPAPLAALATFLVCAYLALFFAAAGWTAVRFGGRSSGPRLALAAAAFAAFEWLKGWLFSGFPWLTLGTSQVPSSPLAGFAPLVGAYGTSLAVTLAAALLCALAQSIALSRERYRLLAALGVLFVAGSLAKAVGWSTPAGAPFTVALLQGNVAQSLKWRDDMRAKTMAEYREMALAAKARVVVLPETALPVFFDELSPAYLEGIRSAARRDGTEILMGTVEREFRENGRYDYYNSLVNLTDPAQKSYRKRHLVPFGEYVPPGFKWILAILHIPLSDFEIPAGAPRILTAAGVRFASAICYEDIFGEEVIELLPDAQVLVNVSNDAWFGRSLAADQHLQASQMRALEAARWMIRSTNTGVTAVIDEHGQVVRRLPPFTRGTLVETVVPRDGTTPYVRWGNVAALFLIAAVAFAARGAAGNGPPH
jgi:apolipoprotein N-acyltransferase